MYFEYGKKVSETIEKSLHRTMSMFSLGFPVAIDHLYDSTIGYRFKDHIQDEY
jgi:hypothetical protein